MTQRPLHQRAFALPSAIFLLVILASLAAFMVRLSLTQNVTSAQDVQGARAYHAARAGIEWVLYRVLDPNNATAVAPTDPLWPNLPPCTNLTTLVVAGFNVAVSCRPNDYNEQGGVRKVRVFTLIARASAGTVATPGYVEREIQVTVEKCRASNGVAPSYACP